MAQIMTARINPPIPSGTAIASGSGDVAINATAYAVMTIATVTRMMRVVVIPTRGEGVSPSIRRLCGSCCCGSRRECEGKMPSPRCRPRGASSKEPEQSEQRHEQADDHEADPRRHQEDQHRP